MTGVSTPGSTVNGNGNGQSAWLLRVYLLAGDRWQGKPLVDGILLAAREAGISGATVLPGIAGYGKSGHHGALEVFLHDPLQQPVVVEMADSGDRLQAFLPVLAEQTSLQRLVTLEQLSVLSYHSSASAEDSAVETDNGVSTD